MSSFTVLKWPCSVSFILPLVFLERGISMYLCPLSPVFLERGIFMCLCPLSQCFRYNSLWTNRQRWTAGSVVTNEMRFSDRQHPRFAVVSIRRIERIGRIDNVGPPGLLSLMRCNFPIDNIHVSRSCPFDESNESVESTTLDRRVCCH